MTFKQLYNILNESHKDSLLSDIQNICKLSIPEIQEIYDQWDQDDDGIDEEYGSGGICDQVSRILSDNFSSYGFDVMEGGQEGDDHAYIFVGKNNRAFEVDVPPNVYEYGGGYSWKKRKGVTFSINDFYINEVAYDDVFEVNN